jgi:hypothetical protein
MNPENLEYQLPILSIDLYCTCSIAHLNPSWLPDLLQMLRNYLLLYCRTGAIYAGECRIVAPELLSCIQIRVKGHSVASASNCLISSTAQSCLGPTSFQHSPPRITGNRERKKRNESRRDDTYSLYPSTCRTAIN